MEPNDKDFADVFADHAGLAEQTDVESTLK